MRKIRYTICLILIVGLGGCSLFADNRIVVKPPPVDIRDRWKILAPFVKNYFETDMSVAEIARWLEAEHAHQEDLIEKKRQESLNR